MNKLFTKISALVLGLTMSIGVGVAVSSSKSLETRANSSDGASTSIVFESNSSDSNTAVSAANLLTATGIVKSNSLIVGCTTASRIYAGQNGVKLGASGGPGTLALTLRDDSKNYIKTITFVTAKYGSDTGKFTFKSGSTTLKSNQTPGSDYTHTFTDPTTVSSLEISTSTKRAYLKSITVTYEIPEPSTTYEVTYDGNGLSGSTASGSGTSVTIADNGFTLPTGVDFLRWNDKADGSGEDYAVGTSVTKNLKLYAIWGYKMTYKANGGAEADVIDHTLLANAYTILDNSFTYEGYMFTKWNTNANGEGSDYSVGSTIATPSAALTLFAQWVVDPYENDLLNKAFTGNPSTYSDWSNKSGSSSSAVYAGNSSGDNGSIQIRGSSNSGIISTTTGGTLAKVSLIWESHTAEGRILDIYGKNEAYKSVSELYDSNTSGTKLGSITYGTSTYLNVTGNYAYVGIRVSTSNAAYLTSITISWTPVTTFTVQYSLNEGTGTTPESVSNLSDNDLKAFTVAGIGNDFYKFGYSCDGWSSTADGSLEYEPSTAYDLSSKKSGAFVYLYAHWTVKTLTGLTAGETEPTTKEYEVGQAFDPTGLTIHAIFDDNDEDDTDITSQVSWDALTKGDSAIGRYSFNNHEETIVISGLTITGPDCVINKDTVPSNVTSTSNSETRTGYIGEINYEYFAFQTYGSNLEFRNSENGYICNLDSYGKYISSIKVILAADSFTNNFAMYQGKDSKPLTTEATVSGSETSRTYSFSGDTEYFTFKKTSTGSWIQIVSIEITLGSAVPERIVDTVTVNNPGTIYDGDSKQLTATVSYVGISYTDSNVTWEKVSGASSITPNGMFTASGTTPTVVKATSVLKNAQDKTVSAEYTITPLEKMIKSGHKYFVVSSDNDIFLAKNLDGTFVSSGSSKEKFLSSAVLSSNGDIVLSIAGISGSLEDYAWIMTEDSGNANQYSFQNAGEQYFNIYGSGSFYVDTFKENFVFAEIDNLGYFTIKSTKTNTFLNISDGTFVTNGTTGVTGYKFIEYKEFGTLDHIEIDEGLSKTEYYQGDTFSLSDVTVVAYDTNGISQIVESGYTCTGYDMSVPGEQTITVTYSEKTDTYSITVIKCRVVMESYSLSETFDYTSGGADMTQSGTIESATIAKGGSTTDESDSIRLGSGSATGSLTVTSSTYLISKLEVWVKSYGSDSSTLNVGTENTGSISSDSFEKFTFEYSNPISSVELSTTASKKRVYIEKVMIYSVGEADIGKTSDCLGLEEYIDSYLHMDDYTSSQGWCKDDKHNYYGKNTETGAKYFFNQLNLKQRTLLSSHSAYASEWARLSAWAAANGDSLNASTQLAASTNSISLIFNNGSNNGNNALLIVVTIISLSALGGYFFIRRRREH